MHVCVCERARVALYTAPVCMCVRACTCVRVKVCLFIHPCVPVCVHLCVEVPVCVCMCVCVVYERERDEMCRESTSIVLLFISPIKHFWEMAQH